MNVHALERLLWILVSLSAAAVAFVAHAPSTRQQQSTVVFVQHKSNPDEFLQESVAKQTVTVSLLQSLGASQAIVNLMLHQHQPNILDESLYTVAIQTVNCEEHALCIFDAMTIRPSTPTLVAVLNQLRGAASVQTFLRRGRYFQNNSNNPLNPRIQDAAIYACGRNVTNARFAMTTALQLFSQPYLNTTRNTSVLPTTTTSTTVSSLQALLFVCAACRDVETTLQLLTHLQHSSSPRLWGAALHVCAVAGDPVVALFLLQQMTARPNARHYTAYLQAILNNNNNDTHSEYNNSAKRLQVACNFLDFLVDRFESPPVEWTNLPRVLPDLIAMKTVLRACAALEDFTLARSIVNKMKNGFYGDRVVYLDEDCYNILLLACSCPKEAETILHEMRLSRRYRVGAVPPSHVTFTRAITVCRKAANPQYARSFLNRAAQDGVQPDTYMYSAAIWTAASAADAKVAAEIFAEMKEHQCRPNSVTYNGMIAAFANSGDPVGAVDMYRELVRAKLQPTAATFQQLARSLRRADDLASKCMLSATVLHLMKPAERTVTVGGPILETLISTYGSLGLYSEARSVFDSIQGPVDAPCLRAILFACSTASPEPEWEEALNLLHTSNIVVNATAPYFVDQTALSNAMLACSKANRWEESLQLLQLYGGNRTSLLAVNSLIGACGRGKRPDMALEILSDMEQQYGLKPDARSYRNAIISCNQAEHEQQRQNHQNEPSDISFQWWECAISLLRRMKESDLKPDTQCYSSVISACEAAGEWQQALSLLQSIMDENSNSSGEEDCVLNLYSYNAAISACEKGGAWVEALDIYERMKEFGGKHLQPNIVTLNSLILALDNAGQKELAETVYMEGLRKRILRPWRTTRTADGHRVCALDLHLFNAAMSKAAIRHYLDSLIGKQQRRKEGMQGLIIIVGKGLHSQDDPVLMPVVKRMLNHDLSIKCTVDERNSGRILISGLELDAYIAKNDWR
jgi:pentatricopeptide repeat domain-containing protein 1